MPAAGSCRSLTTSTGPAPVKVGFSTVIGSVPSVPDTVPPLTVTPAGKSGVSDSEYTSPVVADGAPDFPGSSQPPW